MQLMIVQIIHLMLIYYGVFDTHISCISEYF